MTRICVFVYHLACLSNPDFNLFVDLFFMHFSIKFNQLVFKPSVHDIGYPGGVFYINLKLF